MTSNDAYASGGGSRFGRRRALGRGPGAAPAKPVIPPDADADADAEASARLDADANANAEAPDARGDAGARLAAPLPDSAEAPLAAPLHDSADRPVEGGAGPSETPDGEGQPVQDGARSSRGAEGGASTPEADAESPAGAGDGVQGADDGVFKVRLANFEGPFDLLLQLISKHKLDVTEVALSKVTDEFMAYIRAMGPDWDLDETTEFLVVAATLLDLKAARLLPAAEVEDEADLALLEARDLLFARLLQYRAYKQIADIFNRRLDEEARRYPRTVGLEPHHAELLPEVVISIGPEGFAKLAVKAMQPKPKPQVYVDHIHAPLVSVQEQAGIVVARLKELGEASFRALVEDTDDTLTVVARFLALLELYREKAVALEQETALGDLLVRWTGGDGDETPMVTDEFDRPPEQPEEEKKT
ncbi:segregation/condensation protein A [Streptomyces sp. 15-116A]|uniref:segregation and condensation protein A n=1 Tax=Streptomyces sp. 15-116A TaxID=2259035 RepID=UPI0021B3B403|nr:segregation/condensation protein A [Streptomyces sp. 15-116A]MCT7355359.1 segregation/condensation protein A [Streptomyces sp. 15-116A]